MKIALVSPLPPAPTGVAEYTLALQKELSRHAQATALDSPDRRELESYDTCLYQIGNNRLHAAAYAAALSVPGVAVLHDAVLHHFLLGRLSREQYIEEFVFNYGEWMRHVAQDLWRQRALSGADHRYFEYPMIRRIVESSRAVVVHNPKARRMVTEGEAGKRADAVFEIPHFAAAPALPGEGEQAATRAGLGIPKEAVVIGTFGYMRPSKRLRSLVSAARMLTVPYRLLLVGDFVSADYEAAVDTLIEDAPVIRLPFVPEQEFWRLVAITNICVNLRYPSAGETSGIAAKLMAAGKLVVMTEGEENSAYPANTVVKVDPGESEVEKLAHYLCALAGEPEMRAIIGRNAARYAAEHQSLERVGARYMEVIRRVAESSAGGAPHERS